MNMDQSIRDTLNQLVILQTQQLSAINSIAVSNANVAQKSQMSSYTNYAPDFMPPMAPFSQGTQNAHQQFSQYAGQLAPQQGLRDMIFANQSKMSPQAVNQMATDYGAKLTNATLTGGSVVAQGAADLAGFALVPGMVGGIAAGAVGGAVVGGMFDIALKQNQQHLAYNNFLQRESYRFINPLNSTNQRDIAGFNQKERYSASTYLRHFGAENRISSEDTSQLLEKFTEGNLLKGTKDLEGFKDKMKKMTSYVKQGALTLNETFQDIAGLMADMQKAGIDTTNFDYLAAKAKVVGSFTGQKGGEVIRNAVGAAQNITGGTVLSTTNQTEKLLDQNLYMDTYFQKLKNSKTPLSENDKQMLNLINNVGGPEQAAKIAAQVENNTLSREEYSVGAVNFFDYDKKSGWAFNPEKYKEYISGNKSLRKTNEEAITKLNNTDKAARDEWIRNAPSILANGTDEDQQKLYQMKILDQKQASSPEWAGKKMSYVEKLRIFEGRYSAEDKLVGAGFDQYAEDGGQIKRNAQNLTLQQDMISKINANRAGFGYEVKNVWEKFKNKVGDATVGVGEGFTNASQGLSDWWYGRQYQVDRSGLGAGASGEQLKEQGQNIVKYVLEGMKDGLKDAKSKGFDVSGETSNLFKMEDIKLLNQRLGGASTSSTSTMYNSEGFKKAVETFDYLNGTHVSTVGGYKHVVGAYQLSDEKREKIYRSMAGMYGITDDGSVESYGKITTKVEEEANKTEEMLKDYKNRSSLSLDMPYSKKKGLMYTGKNTKLTKWEQLTSGERATLLQQKRMTDVARGKETLDDITTYQTAEDKEIQRKIVESGGELAMGSEPGEGAGNPENWLKFFQGNKKYIGSDISEATTVAEATAKWQTEVNKLEAEQKSAITESRKMAGADLSDLGDNASLAKAALTGDKASQDQLFAVFSKMKPGDKGFETMNKAFLAMNKATGTSLIQNYKASIAYADQEAKTVKQSGIYLSTIMGSLEGDAAQADFQRRYVAPYDTPEKVKILGAGQIVSDSTTEVVNKLAGLKDKTDEQKKGFYDSLRVDQTAKDHIQFATEKALEKSGGEQDAALKKVVEMITTAMGGVNQATETDPTKKDAASAADKLNESNGKLVQAILDFVKTQDQGVTTLNQKTGTTTKGTPGWGPGILDRISHMFDST